MSLTPGILSMSFGAWGSAGLRAVGKTGLEVSKRKLFLNDKEELNLLKLTAEDLANAIKKGPFRQSNTEAGPVLSLIRDRLTGEIFHAQNIGAIDYQLHPLLQGRLVAYLKDNNRILNPVWGVPGSHSEIQALNQALIRRQSLGLAIGSLEEFSLYNVSLWNNRLGLPLPRCGNCMFLTNGIRVFSGM